MFWFPRAISFVLVCSLLTPTSLSALPAPVVLPADAVVNDIAVGPDGNLWAAGDSLWHIDLSTGALTRFAIPNVAFSVIAGPDGNLWLAGVVSITKVTTTGIVTTYPLTRTAFDLVVGPDGNIWFAGATGLYGRITTSGIVTEYTLGTASFHSVASANGSLWLAYITVDSIVRVDPISGSVIATIPLPNNSSNWRVIPHPQGGVAVFAETGSFGYWIGADNAIRGTLGTFGSAFAFDQNGLLWFGQTTLFGAFDGPRLFAAPSPQLTLCGSYADFPSVAILPDGNVAFLRVYIPGGCVGCGPPVCIDPPVIIFTSFSQLSVNGGIQDAPISPAALAALAFLLLAAAFVRLRRNLRGRKFASGGERAGGLANKRCRPGRLAGTSHPFRQL